MSTAPFGQHLLLELSQAQGLDDQPRIEAALRAAAEACGATVLSVHSHRFSPQGITGVALLAESHLTVHTWPEHDYAAFDLFLCGDADPRAAIAILREAFQAGRVESKLITRGPAPVSV